MNGLDLAALRAADGYHYLASPYSKYPHGLDAAFIEASKAAAMLVQAGIKVFCPIAHSHPIAEHGRIDALDHDIWLPADAPLMRAASGLIVCKMETWEDSYGISVEIGDFEAAGKPIHYMDWPR